MKGKQPTIVVATQNSGKIIELRELVRELPITFLSLTDFNAVPEIIEDGETFEENAVKKARLTSSWTGLAALADDSGLCIDALDGRPGVFSARYAGENASDEERFQKILEEMRDVPEEYRSARFVCVLALAAPSGKVALFRGDCEGRITTEPRGSSGFGYDPIFYFERCGHTFGEMDKRSKNRVSHRGRALRKFATYLESSSTRLRDIIES